MILDHTIVPSHDKVAAARWIADLVGCAVENGGGTFAPVKVNDTLTLDFADRPQFEHHHYAFRVTDAELDGIFSRVQANGYAYGSGPRTQDDMQVNAGRGGRRFYVKDPDGHSWEFFTRP